MIKHDSRTVLLHRLDQTVLNRLDGRQYQVGEITRYKHDSDEEQHQCYLPVGHAQCALIVLLRDGFHLA
jgi:hypothetical protein